MTDHNNCTCEQCETLRTFCKIVRISYAPGEWDIMMSGVLADFGDERVESFYSDEVTS